MQKIFNIITAPTKVFLSLKEKPEWTIPLVIIIVVISFSASVTVLLTKDTIISKQEEIMRERGLDQEQIEQAKSYLKGPLPMVFGGFGAAVFVVLRLLLFALIINLFIPLFNGQSAYRSVFSVVCYSGLIMVVAAILKVILMGVTKSPFVTTSLALLVPSIEKTSFLYQLLAGFDFFIIWEMVLVSIGISITNDVKRQNAYVLIFIIWLVSIFIGIGFGLLRGSGQ